MPRVTASKLSVLRHCSYPYVDGIEFPADPMGPKARAGTAVHLLAEKVLRGEVFTPDDAILECRVPRSESGRVYQMFERWLEWYESLGRPAMRPEVPFGFHVPSRTVSELTLTKQRGYNYDPDTVYGTTDAIWISDDGLCVIDIKTGSPASVQRARENDQLRFLSMCAAKVYGFDSARVVLLFVDEFGHYPDEAEIDYFGMAETEYWLVDRFKQIGLEPPVAGEWCTRHWCGLRPRKNWAGCPAYCGSKESV